MRKLILFTALIGASLASYAQSASEISAAKSMARAYGYSDAEISAVLNHNIGGTAAQTVAAPTVTVTPTVSTPETFNLDDQATDVTIIEPAAPASATSTGNIFGHSYFTSKGLSIIPSYNAPVPASYVLGPGDELVIDIWGATTQHVVSTIGNDGSITLFDLGPVYLSGMNVTSAENYLKEELGRIYSGLEGDKGDTFMRLSVGKIKGVVVSVTGEVAVPGTYTIPSLASVASAIYLAGGVTENATVRNIVLYRSGKEVSRFDLYDLVFKGKFDQNFRLQENDIISVEPYTLVVTASGTITRPMRYELKAGESIADLIEYAAGFRTTSRRDEVNVLRRNSLSGESFDVKDSQFKSFILKDGDVVNFRSNPDVLSNSVTISGPVNYPGTYAISDSLHDVAALVNAAGNLREGAYTHRGQINRLDENRLPVFITFDLEKVLNGEEKVELYREDRVTLFSLLEFIEDYTISVSGHVTNPGTFRFYEGMTVADAILLARGVRDDAFTERGQITRMDHQGVPQIISFDVADVLDGRDNPALVRDDNIRIYSIRELKEDANLTITGEVQRPGTATYREGITLRDVVMLSGGFTNGADLSNLEISSRGGRERGTVATYNLEEHPELMNMGLKPYDIIAVRRLTYFKPQTAVAVEGEVMSPGTYVVDKAETRLSDIISKVGGFTDEAYIHGARLTRHLTPEESEQLRTAVLIANQSLTGRDTINLNNIQESFNIGIKLDKAIENPGSKYDIILRAGDVISVPVRNTTVKVTGAVFYPNTVAYDQSYGWKDYVAQAGGFVKGARKGKAYAVHMNGEVSTVAKGMKIEPGSEIYVPERSQKERQPMSPVEISAIATSTASLASLVASIIRLF